MSESESQQNPAYKSTILFHQCESSYRSENIGFYHSSSGDHTQSAQRSARWTTARIRRQIACDFHMKYSNGVFFCYLSGPPFFDSAASDAMVCAVNRYSQSGKYSEITRSKYTATAATTRGKLQNVRSASRLRYGEWTLRIRRTTDEFYYYYFFFTSYFCNVCWRTKIKLLLQAKSNCSEKELIRNSTRGLRWADVGFQSNTWRISATFR